VECRDTPGAQHRTGTAGCTRDFAGAIHWASPALLEGFTGLLKRSDAAPFCCVRRNTKASEQRWRLREFAGTPGSRGPWRNICQRPCPRPHRLRRGEKRRTGRSARGGLVDADRSGTDGLDDLKHGIVWLLSVGKMVGIGDGICAVNHLVVEPLQGSVVAVQSEGLRG